MKRKGKETKKHKAACFSIFFSPDHYPIFFKADFANLPIRTQLPTWGLLKLFFVRRLTNLLLCCVLCVSCSDIRLDMGSHSHGALLAATSHGVWEWHHWIFEE